MAFSVVALAAGRSTRFGRPKQLEPLGPADATLLEYSLYDARQAGAARIVVVTSHELLAPFQSRLGRHWGGLPVTYTVQRTDQGEADTAAWGTGHAVLAAEPESVGPLVVCNADDFYGRDAWQAAGRFLAERGGAHGEYGLVGYPLERTLSSAGGVSRAICDVDPGGRVQAVREWRDVRRTGLGVEGVGLDGNVSTLPPEAPVSMNLWAFTSDIFPLLRQSWDQDRMAFAGGEFLLSVAIDRLVDRGQAQLRLLDGGTAWFGLTHPTDRPNVVAKLRSLTDAGVYPNELAGDSNP